LAEAQTVTFEPHPTVPPPVVEPPAAGELLVVNTTLQPNPPCVTVKVWPAMVMVPVTGKLLGFAATA